MNWKADVLAFVLGAALLLAADVGFSYWMQQRNPEMTAQQKSPTVARERTVRAKGGK